MAKLAVAVSVIGGQVLFVVPGLPLTAGIKRGSLKERELWEAWVCPVPFVVLPFVEAHVIPYLVGAARQLQVVLKQVVWLQVRGVGLPKHRLGHVQVLVILL